MSILDGVKALATYVLNKPVIEEFRDKAVGMYNDPSLETYRAMLESPAVYTFMRLGDDQLKRTADATVSGFQSVAGKVHGFGEVYELLSMAANSYAFEKGVEQHPDRIMGSYRSLVAQVGTDRLGDFLGALSMNYNLKVPFIEAQPEKIGSFFHTLVHSAEDPETFEKMVQDTWLWKDALKLHPEMAVRYAEEKASISSDCGL